MRHVMSPPDIDMTLTCHDTDGIEVHATLALLNALNGIMVYNFHHRTYPDEYENNISRTTA